MSDFEFKVKWAKKFESLPLKDQRRILRRKYKEREIRNIGSGLEHVVDLVVHPKHGKVVRKIPYNLTQKARRERIADEKFFKKALPKERRMVHVIAGNSRRKYYPHVPEETPRYKNIKKRRTAEAFDAFQKKKNQKNYDRYQAYKELRNLNAGKDYRGRDSLQERMDRVFKKKYPDGFVSDIRKGNIVRGRLVDYLTDRGGAALIYDGKYFIDRGVAYGQGSKRYRRLNKEAKARMIAKAKRRAYA